MLRGVLSLDNVYRDVLRDDLFKDKIVEVQFVWILNIILCSRGRFVQDQNKQGTWYKFLHFSMKPLRIIINRGVKKQGMFRFRQSKSKGCCIFLMQISIRIVPFQAVWYTHHRLISFFFLKDPPEECEGFFALCHLLKIVYLPGGFDVRPPIMPILYHVSSILKSHLIKRKNLRKFDDFTESR